MAQFCEELNVSPYNDGSAPNGTPFFSFLGGETDLAAINNQW